MGFVSPLNLDELEAVLKIMKKYKVSKFADEHFSVEIAEFPEPAKRRKRLPREKELSPKEMLAPHLELQPEEPWMSITDNQLDEYDLTGKVE